MNVRPAGHEDAAGLDEVGLALDLMERPTATIRSGPSLGRGGRPERGSGSTPQWMTSTLPSDAGPAVASISARLSSEIVTTNAASRPCGEHRPVDVEVGAVRREAVRDPGQPVDEEPGEGRVVGEVAMDVIDALVLHRRAAWATFGKIPSPPKRKFGLRHVPADHVAQGRQVAPPPTRVAQEGQSWLRAMAADRNGR